MIQKILMIDDDVDFTEACRNFLEVAGYEVDCESDENLAVEKVGAFKPDLIFLDVLMKTEQGGFEIADRICGDETLRKVPIVFLTGYFRKKLLTDRENEVIGKWDNVKGVLDKPVKPAALLEMVKKMERG
ncbi:MAG TPA: response regulator [Candidatus Omnitrophota bacterium]|nr:response regulator [Candidatus Omnitrophota bacterium]